MKMGGCLLGLLSWNKYIIIIIIIITTITEYGRPVVAK